MAGAIGGVPASNLAGSSAGVKRSSVDAVDHAAAAEERRHGVEQLFAAVEHADAGGAEHLVAAEGEEVGAEGEDVGRSMGHALGGVDQHQRAGRVRPAGDFGDRIDRAEHVRDGGDGDDLRAVGEQRVECVEDEQAVVGDRDVAEDGAGARGQLLPGHEVRVVLHRGEQDFVAALARWRRPNCGRRELMPAVVPGVKITSRACSAPMNARTFSRASSYCSVLRSLSVWMPRWTLA